METSLPPMAGPTSPASDSMLVAGTISSTSGGTAAGPSRSELREFEAAEWH